MVNNEDAFPLEGSFVPAGREAQAFANDEVQAFEDDAPDLRATARQEREKDARSRAVLDFIKTFSQIGKWLGVIVAGIIATIVVVIGAILVIALVAWVIHLFIPDCGWLTPEQQKRAAGMYESVAQVALPITTAAIPLASWWSRRR